MRVRVEIRGGNKREREGKGRQRQGPHNAFWYSLGVLWPVLYLRIGDYIWFACRLDVALLFPFFAFLFFCMIFCGFSWWGKPLFSLWRGGEGMV